MEIRNSDWKRYKDCLPVWQERHMERLNKEYLEILQSDLSHSDKFWKLDERIHNDKRHPGVIVEVRRDEMISTIVTLLRSGTIEMEELSGFSEELRDTIAFLMNR